MPSTVAHSDATKWQTSHSRASSVASSVSSYDRLTHHSRRHRRDSFNSAYDNDTTQQKDLKSLKRRHDQARHHAEVAAHPRGEMHEHRDAFQQKCRLADYAKLTAQHAIMQSNKVKSGMGNAFAKVEAVAQRMVQAWRNFMVERQALAAQQEMVRSAQNRLKADNTACQEALQGASHEWQNFVRARGFWQRNVHMARSKMIM
jgi:hypothetical protein